MFLIDLSPRYFPAAALPVGPLQGTFTELAKGYPGVELNKMFR